MDRRLERYIDAYTKLIRHQNPSTGSPELSAIIQAQGLLKIVEDVESKLSGSIEVAINEAVSELEDRTHLGISLLDVSLVEVTTLTDKHQKHIFGGVTLDVNPPFVPAEWQ